MCLCVQARAISFITLFPAIVEKKREKSKKNVLSACLRRNNNITGRVYRGANRAVKNRQPA